MDKQAVCPGCGAPVVFKISSSRVVVCDYCKAVVARTDLKIEEIGKVASIVDSASPLQVGLRGKYNGKSFSLTGRTQLKHQMGGVWDEWYAAFSNGRWGWLAEAQGRYYLTFETKLPKDPPSFEELQVGQGLVRTAASSLVVAEKGVAEHSAAEGEIPFIIQPGLPRRYADLSSTEGQFATLDYGTSVGPASSPAGTEAGPTFYLGKEVTLQELGIDAAKLGPGRERSKVSSAKVSCPKCGGALVLMAPDQAQRVVCQYCKSMLDADQGNLKFMETLNPKREPFIALGKKGEIGGFVMTCIGFMLRSTELEGQTWYWEEYLLYNPQVGFRWLVFTDDQWFLAGAVQAAAVKNVGATAVYDGKTFHRSQQSTGKVEYVLGEFYWKVTIGELTEMEDFVCGNRMLSKETSSYAGGGGEVNWSHGTQLTQAEVCKKFGIPYTPAVGCPTWVVILCIIAFVLFIIWVISESSGPTSAGGRAGWFYGAGGGFGGGK